MKFEKDGYGQTKLNSFTWLNYTRQVLSENPESYLEMGQPRKYPPNENRSPRIN